MNPESDGTKIRNVCYYCGSKLYYYGTIDTRNYVYHKNKYMCYECFGMNKKKKKNDNY